ncbi:hypothetical protein [Glutamicibacter halophytocola]|uniref:hypothetical protein n=1 Tax=Glutamicibacter halophytocola TaxID=1933880 RepID=UPI0015C53472|nr:hypothetical protein [Glutamicibacter halophytocola]NQD39977.1 hypothetical protein [Glutamicibacter halophytocola]
MKPKYLDQALTNVANAWQNEQEDFIAEKLFPVVPVKKKTFKIPEYGKENLELPGSIVRTGLSKAKSAAQSRTYKDAAPLQELAMSTFVTRDDYEMSDEPFEPESDATEFLMEQITLAQEKALADKLTDATIITNNRTLSGTSQWSDYTNSDPISDIQKAVTSKKFIKFNTLAMSRETYLTLISHPVILERFKYTQGGAVSKEQLLQLFGPFGIKNIFIGQASANMSPEGVDEDIQGIWGRDVLVGYVTDRPTRKTINGGYTFVLEGRREVTKNELQDPDATKIVATDYRSQELMIADAWYLLKDAVAA